MSIKKINLSALQWNIDQENQEEVITQNENSIEMIKEEPKEIKSNNKAKISLRNLKKSSPINSVETPEIISTQEIKEENTENKEIIDTKDSNFVSIEKPSKPKISLKSTQKENDLSQVKTEIIENWEKDEVKEEVVKNKEIISELSNETKKSENTEILVKQEKFKISDWDTSCNFVNEKKTEIFSNYKWSFSKETTENKTQTSTEKIKNEIPTQVIEHISENKEDVKLQEASRITKDKTNLERYSESEIIAKKQKQKKVVVWGIVWLLSVCIPGLLFSQNMFLKWNINETKDIPKITTEIVKEKQDNSNENILETPSVEEVIPENFNSEEIIQNTPESVINTPEVVKQDEKEIVNTTEIIDIENNQMVNNEIVKENEIIQVDNIQKTTTINPKVQNYLLQKYKK